MLARKVESSMLLPTVPLTDRRETYASYHSNHNDPLMLLIREEEERMQDEDSDDDPSPPKLRLAR